MASGIQLQTNYKETTTAKLRHICKLFANLWSLQATFSWIAINFKQKTGKGIKAQEKMSG